MKRYKLSDIFFNSQKHLNEKSFDEEDVPKVFYLISYISEEQKDFAEQLSNNKLEGVVGISDNKLIIPSFLGIGRNVLLIMPGKEVVTNNNLTKIQYQNINYLLSNNMRALYRVFEKNPNSSSGKNGLMENIMNYIETVTKPWNINEPFGFLMKNLYEGYWRPQLHFSKSNISINNIYDLAKFLHFSADNFHSEKVKSLSYTDFIEPIKKAFIKIGSVYEQEGEWILKNKTLIIPNNSSIIFSVPKNPNDFTKEQMKLILSDNKIFEMDWNDAYAMKYYRNLYNIVAEYDLDKVYKIIWLSEKQFEKLKNKLRTVN